MPGWTGNDVINNEVKKLAGEAPNVALADYLQFKKDHPEIKQATLTAALGSILPELILEDVAEGKITMPGQIPQSGNRNLTATMTIANLRARAANIEDPTSGMAQEILQNLDFLSADGLVTGSGDAQVVNLGGLTRETINGRTEFTSVGGKYAAEFLNDGTILWRDNDDKNRIRRVQSFDGKSQTIDYDGDRVSRYTDSNGKQWYISPYIVWNRDKYLSDGSSDVYDSIAVNQNDGTVSLINSQSVTSARGSQRITYTNPGITDAPYTAGDTLVVPNGKNGTIEYESTNGTLDHMAYKDSKGNLIGQTDYDASGKVAAYEYPDGMKVSLIQIASVTDIWSYDANGAMYPIPVNQQDNLITNISYADGSTISYDGEQWHYHNQKTNKTYAVEAPDFKSVDITSGTDNSSTYTVQMAPAKDAPPGSHGAQATFSKLDGTLTGLNFVPSYAGDTSNQGRIERGPGWALNPPNPDWALINLPPSPIYEQEHGTWTTHNRDGTDGPPPNPPPKITLKNGTIDVILPDGTHYIYLADGTQTIGANEAHLNDGTTVTNPPDGGIPNQHLTFLYASSSPITLPDGSIVKADSKGFWFLYPPKDGRAGSNPVGIPVGDPVIVNDGSGTRLSFATDTNDTNPSDLKDDGRSYQILLRNGAIEQFAYGGIAQSITRPDGSNITLVNGQPTEIHGLPGWKKDKLALTNGIWARLTEQSDGSWVSAGTVNVQISPDYSDISVTDPSTQNGSDFKSDLAGNETVPIITTVTNDTGTTNGLQNGQVTDKTRHDFPSGDFVDDENGIWVYNSKKTGLKLVVGSGTIDDTGNLYIDGQEVVPQPDGTIPISLGGGVTAFESNGDITRIQIGQNDAATINFSAGVPSSLSLNDQDVYPSTNQLFGGSQVSISIPANAIPAGWLTNTQRAALTWNADGIIYTISADFQSITAQKDNISEVFTFGGVSLVQ